MNLSYPADFGGKQKPPLHMFGYKHNSEEQWITEADLQVVFPFWSTSTPPAPSVAEYDLSGRLSAIASPGGALPPSSGNTWGSGRAFIRGTDTTANTSDGFFVQLFFNQLGVKTEGFSASLSMTFICSLVPGAAPGQGSLCSWQGDGSGLNYGAFINSDTTEIAVESAGALTSALEVNRRFVDDFVDDVTQPFVVNITWTVSETGQSTQVRISINASIVLLFNATVSSPAPELVDLQEGHLNVGVGVVRKPTQNFDGIINCFYAWRGMKTGNNIHDASVTSGFSNVPIEIALDPFWPMRPANSGMRVVSPEPPPVVGLVFKRFPYRSQLHNLGR